MRILAFDTSSAVTAVAVTDGDRVLAHDDRPGEQRHAELLLPRIEAALARAQLELAAIELIAVGIGPGSFTGLRVGLATAKGLALATRLPLCGVSSLRVLGRALDACDKLAVCALDAGKGELFGAVYGRRAGELETLIAPLRAEPAVFARTLLERGLPAAGLLWCGAGARRYAAELAGVLDAPLQLAEPSYDVPSGQHVAAEALARFRREGPSDLSALEPVYLRGSDAKLPDEPLAL
jgi:tRNA threonylcarbamoyladenosine biosynthesis protein TsaB